MRQIKLFMCPNYFGIKVKVLKKINTDTYGINMKSTKVIATSYKILIRNFSLR
jgi:hypothetical protein